MSFEKKIDVPVYSEFIKRDVNLEVVPMFEMSINFVSHNCCSQICISILFIEAKFSNISYLTQSQITQWSQSQLSRYICFSLPGEIKKYLLFHWTLLSMIISSLSDTFCIKQSILTVFYFSSIPYPFLSSPCSLLWMQIKFIVSIHSPFSDGSTSLQFLGQPQPMTTHVVPSYRTFSHTSEISHYKTSLWL